jgi:hypothetical protein
MQQIIFDGKQIQIFTKEAIPPSELSDLENLIIEMVEFPATASIKNVDITITSRLGEIRKQFDNAKG